MPAAPDTDFESTSRGRLIVILGPSGAGKDTLLAIAARELRGRDDLHFVRRTITRPAHGESEDFTPMGEGEFDRALAGNAFCFHWSANGLRYGLPRSMADWLATGRVAVVNGSRAAYAKMKARFGSVAAVSVQVRPDVLAERLRRRGRESESEIAARISRAQTYDDAFAADFVIDNSGAAEIAGAAFARLIAAEADALKASAE